VCVAAEPGFLARQLRPSRLAVADDRTTGDRGHSENGGDEEARPLAQTRASDRRPRRTSVSWGQSSRPSAPRRHRHGGPARAAAAASSVADAAVGDSGDRAAEAGRCFRSRVPAKAKPQI
jgi:hypothetical protein